MYTIKEFCEIFKITRDGYNGWVRKGIVKPTKIGGIVRITQEEVDHLKKGEQKMKKVVCKKCGSISFEEKNSKNGTHRGLYCLDCGSWIKWLGKNEKYKTVRTKEAILEDVL